MTAFRHPPAILTFVAPAERCNQRCPRCYLTEVVQEPVRDFELSPDDLVRFISDFVDAGIPILTVNFQGYEVTLPKSWPYVEAVFAFAQKHDLPRSFITNGMLLHKWTDRIRALKPHRVGISLDGAAPEVNDSLRGLDGAFDCTVQSVEKFLNRAPEYREQLLVVSILYLDQNYESLRQMPSLLSRLGIKRWALGFELGVAGNDIHPIVNRDILVDRLSELRRIARAEGIQCHVSDELGYFADIPATKQEELHACGVYDPTFWYRVDPLGYVRTGREIATVWNAESASRWDPTRDNALDTVEYWRRAKDARARIRREREMPPNDVVASAL